MKISKSVNYCCQMTNDNTTFKNRLITKDKLIAYIFGMCN